MELQKIFDIIVKHLRTQKKACVAKDDSTLCLYRGPGGLKCAAGVLIPDSAYRPEMERKTVDVLLQDDRPNSYCKPLADKLDTQQKQELVSFLQSVHDSSSHTGLKGKQLLQMWEKKFQVVATEFGLTYKPPTVKGKRK